LKSPNLGALFFLKVEDFRDGIDGGYGMSFLTK